VPKSRPIAREGYPNPPDLVLGRVHALSADVAPRDNATMPSLVKVLSASSIMEGEIVKARLEGEGIPVLLKGGGSDPYGVGLAYVFVPTEFETQARLVLEDVGDETSG
jgi:Putative prokaryotic signal transducing protein